MIDAPMIRSLFLTARKKYYFVTFVSNQRFRFENFVDAIIFNFEIFLVFMTTIYRNGGSKKRPKMKSVRGKTVNLAIFWVQQKKCVKNTFFWLAPPNKTFAKNHEKYPLASNTTTFSVSKIQCSKGVAQEILPKMTFFQIHPILTKIKKTQKYLNFRNPNFRIWKFGRYHHFQIWNFSALYDNNLSKLRLQKKTQNEICSGENSKFGDFLGPTKKVLKKHFFLTCAAK